MSKNKLLVFLMQLMGCACLLLPVSVFASALVTVSSIGGGNFQIEGAGIEGAAAFDLSLSYDASVLSNPRVAVGSLVAGGMMETNANTLGVLRMAIIRVMPVNGNGQIAAVSFNQNGANLGKVYSLTAKLFDINGQPQRVATQIINATEPSAKALPTATPTTTIASNNTTSSDEERQPVDLPVKSASETQPVSLNQPELPSGVESESISASPAKVAAVEQIIIHKSVLDRFKEYAGKRSIETFSELFNRPVSAECNQNPPVVLSDGKSQVKALLTSTTGAELTSFDVTAAQLISVKENPNNVNAWIANLLPEKGSISASIAFKQGANAVVCPLTIAPQANIDFDQSESITDADVRLYFSTRKSKKSFRFDLNQDGKRDYLDDYIFVANYLVVTNSKRVFVSHATDLDPGSHRIQHGKATRCFCGQIAPRLFEYVSICP